MATTYPVVRADGRVVRVTVPGAEDPPPAPLAFTLQCGPRFRARFEAASPAGLLDGGLSALAGLLARRRPDYWRRLHFCLCVVTGRAVREQCLALSIPADVASAGEWLDEHAGRLWDVAGRLAEGGVV